MSNINRVLVAGPVVLSVTIWEIDTVSNAGCGTGYGMLVIAPFLRPRKIIGLL